MRRTSPKAQAVLVGLSAPAALEAVASLAPAKFAPKCRPVGATHPSGLVLDIIGIATDDRGCRCEDHMVCCSELLKEDFAVRLRMERILVLNLFCREGEETGGDGRYRQLGDRRCQLLPCEISPTGICP